MDYLHQRTPDINAPHPDMILLDMSLPKLDGMKVLERIKSDPDLRSIPIIALTNCRADPEIINACDLHVTGFIIKPVDFKQFVEIIKRTCNFWLSVAVLPSVDKQNN